ncbi:MAG: FAD-binding protein [Turicibacter sp.]
MRYKINLKPSRTCDVFVMGAGIAGVMSALHASKQGCQVVIASSVNLLSGSSFYKGTWGLGLIGPVDEQDEENLVHTIKEVGCQMVNDAVVKKFVSRINPSIEVVKQIGIELKSAQDESQQEFIPCFDHKHRNWNGLLFKSAKEVFTKELQNENITPYPNSLVVEIVKNENKVVGVILINQEKQLEFIKCKSIIIASGGFGGLYKYRLNTSDIMGMGQALALKAGCQLVNLEFMQMMPGYVSPCYKTIFNEKVFKYLDCLNEDRTPLFYPAKEMDDLLKIRSTHGPFTSRLASRDIDVQLYEGFLKQPAGVLSRYKESIKENHSEFVTTYFEWLKKEKHVGMSDEFRLGIFFHAANGGIMINEFAQTNVPGIFAAGEATGGMHGADRLGGLSTANGLVFGMIAGVSAANYAKEQEHNPLESYVMEVYQFKQAKDKLGALQEIMFKHAMISKNEAGLANALDSIEQISNTLEYEGSIDVTTLHESYELQSSIALAKAILSAMQYRKESRGSHYRSDYPTENKQLERMITVSFNKELNVRYNKGEDQLASS